MRGATGVSSRRVFLWMVCAVLPLSASGAPAAIEAPSQGDGSADPGTMEPVQSSCHGDAAKADGILFLSRRPGGARDDNYDIYRAELDGSNVRRVTDLSEVSIRWFDKDPVRDRLVVAGSSDGDLSIGPSGKHGGASSGEQFIAIVEPGEPLHLLIDIRSDSLNSERFIGVWHPTFAPDGKRIVFSGSKRGESANLWMVNSDGTDLRRLIDDPRRTYNDPRFGPNGKVVFVRHDAMGMAQLLQANNLDVWILDPDRPGSAQRVTPEDSIPGPATIDTDPAMSPDCRWVASVRASQPLSPRSLLRPASDNVVFGIGDDNPGQYDRLQHGENPLRVHGVPTWQDSSTLLSYRWDTTGKGWRIIRYRLDSQDNDVEVMDLGAPIGGEDLLPLAYSQPGRR